MPIRAEHEMHSRRKTRNVGVGLMLAAFVVLILAITFAKVTSEDFAVPDLTEASG
ncbi:MAG: cytochrome C oxidase assembly protein [Pseudomonadota bacterium]